MTSGDGRGSVGAILACDCHDLWVEALPTTAELEPGVGIIALAIYMSSSSPANDIWGVCLTPWAAILSDI
jgi:hypothetical protein